MIDRREALFPARQTALVVVAALAVRVAYRISAGDALFMQTPVVDASFFDIWARTLADGRVFQAQVFFKPPFQAYLLSWFYRAGLGMSVIQVLQMGAGVVTAVLALGVGRLAFDRSAGLIGALVVALLPIFPFFENQLLAEPWTGTLFMAAVLMLVAAATGRTARVGRTVFLAGLLLGIAALGRPNLMLPAVAAAIWFGWRGTTRSARSAPTAGLLLVGLFVGMAPATFHNLKYGALVPVSANLGPNLVAGHSDTADGIAAIPVGVQWDDLQLQTRQAGARDPVAASRFLTRQALEWMAAHPGRTLGLLGKKIVLLVNARAGRNNINPRWMAEIEGVFLLARWWPGVWLMMPLALLGLVRGARGSAAGTLLLWILAASALAILPFFVNARFRLPLLPILALYSGVGAVWLLESWRSGAWSVRIKPLVVFLVAFAVVNVDWFGLADDRWLARDHFNQGLAWSRDYGDRKADPARAEASFREAARLDPTDVDIQERLGALLLMKAQPYLTELSRREQAGETVAAAVAARRAETLLAEADLRHGRAVMIYPRSFRSWLNKGIAGMWRGDLKSFEVRRDVATGDSAAARESALAALGHYRDAVDDFQRSLEIDSGQQDIRRNIQLVFQAIRNLPDVDPAITDFKNRLPTARTDSGPR